MVKPEPDLSELLINMSTLRFGGGLAKPCSLLTTLELGNGLFYHSLMAVLGLQVYCSITLPAFVRYTIV
jgi:hypothetical protein